MKGFLHLRGNKYYFRCRVPHDLYDMFSQRREVVKSLHTRDKRVAKDTAAEWYCRTTRIFNLCRFKCIPDVHLQELIQSELFPSRKKLVQPASPLLNDLFDTYIREHKVNWREKSYDEVTYSLELALDVIGNIQTSRLSPEVIKSFLATILLLPANHRKKPAFRDLKVSEIIKLDGITPMSHKSVCKHMQWLGAALKHAKMEHLLYGIVLPAITRNPYEERSVYDLEDNGVRNALINNFNPLDLRNDAGELWENYLVIERMKRQEYLREPAGNYFWRTYTKKELDLVEERNGKLCGYEMKWGKAKPRPPKEWTTAYPDASWQLINRENYLEFIVGR